MKRYLLSVILLASCAMRLEAQAPGAPNIMRQEELSVRVTYENGRSAGPNLRVELLGAYGGSVTFGTTDTSGMVVFTRLDPAKYKLRVTGPGIATTETGEIDMADSGPRMNYGVQVKRDASTASEPPAGTVDANVPRDAKKEFDQAEEKMRKEDWNAAQGHLEKAIAIYPKYALAQNGLGIVYLRLKQGDKAIAAFRMAAHLDEHLSQANLYLGQFYYDNKQFKEAEPYLQRAENADPQNPQVVLALANTQFRNGELDLALANALKVHTLPDHKKYAVAHLIAAEVLTDKGDNIRAIEEYRLFLKEDPNSPMAPRVKETLAKMQTASK